jgi:uncharacterized membrane protein YhaH (DUF805 family)
MFDLRKFLFGFDGRINRAKYWLATSLCALIVIALMLIAWQTLGSYYALVGPPTQPISFVSWVPVSIALFPAFAIGTWIYAATIIKRLHDRNRSGWWALPFLVVPTLLGYVGDMLGDSYAAFAVQLVAGVLTLWGFVETFCLRGTRGANRFGPDPLPKTRRGTIFA